MISFDEIDKKTKELEAKFLNVRAQKLNPNKVIWVNLFDNSNVASLERKNGKLIFKSKKLI
jgi:hypothetical protein